MYASVSGGDRETPAADDDQESADARSAPTALLHPWWSSSRAPAIAFHEAGPLAVSVVARTARYCFRPAARIELARAKRRTYARRAGLTAGAPLPPTSSLGTT